MLAKTVAQAHVESRTFDDTFNNWFELAAWEMNVKVPLYLKKFSWSTAHSQEYVGLNLCLNFQDYELLTCTRVCHLKTSGHAATGHWSWHY